MISRRFAESEVLFGQVRLYFLKVTEPGFIKV